MYFVAFFFMFSLSFVINVRWSEFWQRDQVTCKLDVKLNCLMRSAYHHLTDVLMILTYL